MQNLGLIDAVWMLVAALFVLLMQGGFLLLEAGRTRSRNSISVAQKNITDLLIAWVTFAVIGFAIAFGPSLIEGSPLGYAMGNPGWHWDTQKFGVYFVYQVGFCAAAATIVSGAVAERMRFWVYGLLTVVLVVLVYPMVARAAWGNLLDLNNDAWLANFGFIDAAGSTVVHALGGWAALAACLLIGRRVDVPKGGEVQGYSDVLALMGALLLMIGWIGFNAGSAQAGSPEFTQALVNTVLATATGGVAGLALGAWLDDGISRPTRSINGVLGGLVAITASATFAERELAMLIGMFGGAISVVVSDFLREQGVDDPLDAIATHGFAGLFGTIAVAFVAPVAMLKNGSVTDQLIAQIAGSAFAFVFAFGTTWIVLFSLSKVTPLRIDTHGERVGLNVSEHGAGLGTDRLQRALTEQIETGPGFLMREKFAYAAHGEETSGLAETIDLLVDQYDNARAIAEHNCQRLDDFANTASDFLWETDSELRVTFVSQRFADLYGHEPSSVNGLQLHEAFGIEEQSWALLIHQVRHDASFENVVGNLHGNDERSYSVQLRGCLHHDANGDVAGMRGTANDITETRSYQDQLRRFAYKDDLTGLLNRRSLRELLDELSAAQSDRGPFAVVMFDLDGFKAVNDTFGHHAGDELLIEVSKRLSAICDTNQHAARTGGDEFVAVLNGFPAHDYEKRAMEWARTAVKQVQQPIALAEATVCVGVSAGVCVSTPGELATDVVLQNADRALYYVKRQGGQTVMRYDPSLDQSEEEQRQLERAIADGIEHNEFYIEYQPRFGAQEQLIGCEALLRWRRSDGNLVPPNQFIPVAEKSMLIHRLGSFVLENACKDAAEWGMRYPQQLSVPVSVNVSVNQLNTENFVDQVKQALANSGLPANRLQLELTESVLVSKPEHIIHKLEDLRALGVTIALDDFGTGFSSLNYLRALPVDRLKIDRAFVQDLGDELAEEAIVNTIISLGRSLDLDVIAEGVEHAEQLDALARLGCRNYQGFYFSKPVEKSQLVNLFATDQIARSSEARRSSSAA